jgi:hypothetical protein
MNFSGNIYQQTEGQWCETPEAAYKQGVKTALMHYVLKRKQDEVTKAANMQDPSTPAAYPTASPTPDFMPSVTNLVVPSDARKDLASSLAQTRAGQKKLQSMALKGRS